MKTFLVYDCGLYCSQASALSEEGKNRVLYYTPFVSAFPKYKDYAPGEGFEYLEKIKYFDRYIEQADAIVFFDLDGNDRCENLKKQYPDKAIYGASQGVQLEDSREKFKKCLELLELPINPYVKIKGITALREYLKKNPDKYVKMDIFRADQESFYAPDYNSVEEILDDMGMVFGPHKEDREFIVENALHSEVEAGFDGFFNGSEYLSPFFIGYEYKKGLYVAHVTDEMPEPLGETLEAFNPVFNKAGYRGAISTEEIIISPKEHYFIDACMRLPSPLGALYPVMIKNWAEVVYAVGKGEYIEPEIEHKYVGAYPIESDRAEKHYVKVNIKKGHEEDVRLMMACGNNKGTYAVKGFKTVAVLVAGGNSVDEVLEKLKKNVEYIDAQGIDKDGVQGIDLIKDIIESGKKVGIEF